VKEKTRLERPKMAKVNDKQLKKTLPMLLTPPNLNYWDRNVLRERNEYHQTKFRKNAPSVEQEKFKNVINALTDYKEAQELLWKGNNHNNHKHEKDWL
jgi:hypothetical protein